MINKKLENVRFLGDLSTEELVSVYHASDLFVSFSTFNDEDYGMSLAEALMCGLPAVLSQWEDFSSYKNYSSDVELVPVEFQDVRMHVQSAIAQKKLMAKILNYKKKAINQRDK